MRLSIVVPTWNGRALLEACLNSLRAQSWRGFEVIVSDDGSTDDTITWLAEEFPEVLVERLEVNHGFVAAANLGIARAHGDWVFLINNDVTLAEDCLEKLMATAERGDAAMLTPLVLWTEDPRLVYSAGDRIGANGRPESIGYRLERSTFALAECPFGVSGGYGLFRRDLLDAVGLLDPAFGAYFEDADLCFRARWAGYEARLVPEALAWHVGSASISNRLWWRTKQCHSNHALLVIKNFSFRLLVWNAPALLAERWHQNLRLFQVARSEWGAARALGFVTGAWLDMAAKLPGALAQRRQIMRSRKISNHAMQELLRGNDHE